MSSSECSDSDGVHEESCKRLREKVAVAEGYTDSLERSSDSIICGTLEKHQLQRKREASGGAAAPAMAASLGRSESWDGGRRSVPSEREASGRGARRPPGLPRSRSWGAELRDDDGGSEVRILRERLVRTQSRPQPATVRLLTRHQRLTLASLALVDFMSFCSMSIMAPFFPREASDKGMSDIVSGFVFSFYALVMFLSSPVFGKILPVIGAKFMFMSGMFVAGSCNILFGKVGGFGLPFYVLGVLMVMSVPINCYLLVEDMEYTLATKSGSVLQLLKIPSIIITGLVIVIVSNIWAFLDPTLEPHLRQYALSTQQIGLIFLLFSALYGIFSPIWGYLADRVDNHWCMMVWGLLLCTVGLLLLGPSPFLPALQSVLWLDLVALSILGISVALTLLPTFQGVLSSSIYEGGYPEALATYSVVAGMWSCCYSLGEVLGPAMGGALTSYYGFPLCTTIMAAACFTMAVIALTFFSLKESSKLTRCSASLSGSLPYSDATWDSNELSISCGTDPLLYHDTIPLAAKYHTNYGSSHAGPSRSVDTEQRKKRSGGGASVAESLAYVLMFRFVTERVARAARPACARTPGPAAACHKHATTTAC